MLPSFHLVPFLPILIIVTAERLTSHNSAILHCGSSVFFNIHTISFHLR